MHQSQNLAECGYLSWVDILRSAQFYKPCENNVRSFQIRSPEISYDV